jgi:hypothetical protein
MIPLVTTTVRSGDEGVEMIDRAQSDSTGVEV